MGAVWSDPKQQVCNIRFMTFQKLQIKVQAIISKEIEPAKHVDPDDEFIELDSLCGMVITSR
jgi:hypothetical protein